MKLYSESFVISGPDIDSEISVFWHLLQNFGHIQGERIAMCLDVSDANMGFGRQSAFQESLIVSLVNVWGILLLFVSIHVAIIRPVIFSVCSLGCCYLIDKTLSNKSCNNKLCERVAEKVNSRYI